MTVKVAIALKETMDGQGGSMSDAEETSKGGGTCPEMRIVPKIVGRVLHSTLEGIFL